MGAWDVVIVGAGPAGSVAAISALRQSPGARVLLLDRETFPRDKICGDALGAGCFGVLGRLGLEAIVDDYPSASEMTLASRSLHAQHPLHGPFRVVPRKVLDARLVTAALASGAVLERRHVREIDVSPDLVTIDRDIEARVVVGADGAESVVRRHLLLKAAPSGGVAVAIRGYGRTVSPVPRIVSQSNDWPAYAWEFPIGDGRSNIGYVDVPRRGKTVTRSTMLRAAADLLPAAATDRD